MADHTISNPAGTIILADVTDHNPTAGVALVGTRTDQIDLTSLAAGAWRQSAKIDFGASRADRWFAIGCFEPVSAPTATGAIEVFLAPSTSATAANNNPGNLSGSDAAYVGYGAAATDADECRQQLGQRIIYAPPGADDDVQVVTGILFTPPTQWVIVVVRNGWNVNLEGDAVEMSIHLIPVLSSVA